MSFEYSVLIVGACIVIIPAADGATQYKDLVDSVLLAQLIANKKIEKAPDVDWYNAYVEFLDDYWLRHTRARQEWPIAQDSVESVSDWVIAAISQDAVDKGSATAATLQRLARLSGNEPQWVCCAVTCRKYPRTSRVMYLRPQRLCVCWWL